MVLRSLIKAEVTVNGCGTSRFLESTTLLLQIYFVQLKCCSPYLILIVFKVNRVNEFH
jgi:hypothetical protein